MLEKECLDVQVAGLKDFTYISEGREIVVTYKPQMTLIDGKVLNSLTGTASTQCCPICWVKPKILLETTDFHAKCFTPRPPALKYGVSPLHAWIRFFELVLNVSYRLKIQKWHIAQAYKTEMMCRKKEIQKMMWTRMGLHVSIPKQNGSGNSNDGNTARRAFRNYQLFSSITSFDQNILYYFYIVLITISCEHCVDVEKFKIFCEKTFLLYVNTYPWYPISPTVHKILVHGWQIMNSSLVPV